MIQLRFKLTWPLAILILIAVAAWLLRHATQAHPAARPIRRATIIDMPPANGQQEQAEGTFDRIYREAAEAGRRAHDEPTEFTGAAARLRSKRYAQQAR